MITTTLGKVITTTLRKMIIYTPGKMIISLMRKMITTTLYKMIWKGSLVFKNGKTYHQLYMCLSIEMCTHLKWNMRLCWKALTYPNNCSNETEFSNWPARDAGARFPCFVSCSVLWVMLNCGTIAFCLLLTNCFLIL